MQQRQRSCVSKHAYMHLLSRFLLFLHSMTTLDHANHAIRRKSYAQHYTPSNVAQFQPEMQEFTFQLIHVRMPFFFRQTGSYMRSSLSRSFAGRVPSTAWPYSDILWWMSSFLLCSVIASERSENGPWMLKIRSPRR